jgi:hypothetical protein
MTRRGPARATSGFHLPDLPAPPSVAGPRPLRSTLEVEAVRRTSQQEQS